MSRSIFSRIIVLHVIAVVITTLVILVSSYYLFDNIFKRFARATLLQREITIAKVLDRTPSAWSLRVPVENRDVYSQQSGGYSYVVVDAHSKVLFSSGGISSPFLPPVDSSSLASYVRPQSGRGLLIAASFPETRNGATVWVQVAQDLGNPNQVTDDVMKSALETLLWVVPGVILLLAVADAIIISRALSPAIEASRIAEQIYPHRIDLRLPTDNLPGEVRPLAIAVNRALDRLEEGFRIQREFTADAAHELRTPLTIARLRIDDLCEPATAAALKADIDVMARIVGQLLSIAELEAVTIDLDCCADLNAVASRVSDYLGTMAVSQEKQVVFKGAGEPVWVRGDDELIFQALRNLAENGIIHTAKGSAVEVEVSPLGRVRVLDRGPGVPEADRQQLFQRFWRKSRNTSTGTGLGLAITARIVEAHGGGIAVADRPGGGAIFEIELQPVGTA